MKILGIDQSYTKCAWVIIEDDCVKHFGVITSDQNEDMFARALFVAREIGNVYTIHSPSVVHIEGLAFRKSGNRTRDLAGLFFVILTRLLDIDPDVTYKILSPKSVKLYATNNGNAGKGDMIDALPTNVKKDFMDENFKKTTGLADLADAYWIGMYKKK